MEAPSLERLQELIGSIRATTEKEISGKLVCFPDLKGSPDVTCSFYLVKCTSQEVREKDLADFLVDKIVRYALRREDILRAGTDPDAHSRNFRKARAKFIQGRPTREAGELLLFLLLESRGIVQVLNKMALKTNTEMYYHGLDAVHVEVGPIVTLHLGSSKIKKDLTDGVTDSLKEMEEHATSVKRQDTEINLISSYIDDSKFAELTPYIQKIVDPYADDRQNFAQAYSMLVCADYEFLQGPYSKPAEKSLEQFLSEEFQKQHSGLLSKITASVPRYSNVSCKPTHFYMIPFRNVEDFCRLFSEVLKN
jgi:hypothetical protein